MRRILMVAVAVASVGTMASGLFGTTCPAQARGINVTAVRPFGIDSYTEYYRAGQLVSVAVSGDGDSDLDLFVYDPFSRLVGLDDDEFDDCLVRFVAPRSGFYTIKVKNLGGLSNAYAIGVN